MRSKVRILAYLAMVVLTARLGKIDFQDHRETYYNLNMNNIVERADEFYGVSGVYEVREDGVKTYNGLAILATDWEVYPFGSIVETSLGTGIVLDHHTTDKDIVDIAVEW